MEGDGASGRANSPLSFLSALTYALGAVLLAIVIIICAQSSTDPGSVSGVFVAAAMAVLLGAILSPRAGALTFVVCYFFAMFMAVPAAVQISQDSFPFGGSYSTEQLNAGLLVVALGLLSLLVGMGLASAHGSPKKKDVRTIAGPSTKTASAQQSIRLALRLSLVFTAVAAALGTLAGPSKLFTPRADATDDLVVDSQGLLIARSFAVVALLLCIIAIQRPRERTLHHASWLCLIPVAAVAFVVNFPPALPRFQLLGIVLAVAVLLVDFHRPLVKALFTGMATFFLFFAFASVKDLSSNSLLTSFTPNSLAQWDPGQYLLSVDFDGFKQTVDTLIYYSNASPRWGVNFLGVFLFWIPRALWPGKPVPTGQIVSEGLGYWYTNVSNPLPAEAFASWGLAGVIIVLLIAGVIVMRIERSVLQPGELTVPRLSLYALATGYSTILLRGALNAVAPMICTVFVLTVVVNLVYRRYWAFSDSLDEALLRKTQNGVKRAQVGTAGRRGQHHTRAHV
ncbi:MAG: hypothetical protein ABF648_11300 [Propionibacterium sp.]